MESGGRAYEVGIPHPNDVLDAHFSHEKTVHPAKGELDEFYVVLLQMRCEWCCYATMRQYSIDSEEERYEKE